MAQMLNRMKERLSAARPRLAYVLGAAAPSLVSIDVSGDCNLRCLMCSLAESNPARGMMTLGEFLRVSRQIKGAPVIELSSGCEPTLNPDLIPMLALARRDHPQTFLNLTTNATRLTKEICAALIDQRVNKLLVSLDAAEPTVYERIRRGAKFQRVVENVCRCAAMIREKGADRPEIEVIFTFMTINSRQLEPLVDLVADMGIRSLIVNGLVPFSKDTGPLAMWEVSAAPPLAQDLAIEASRRGREKGVRVLFADFSARQVRRCWDVNPVIAWNGDVSPCFMCSFARTAWIGNRPIRFPRIVLGNVHRTPLWAIWTSARAVAFRATRAVGALPRYCRACAMQMNVLCPYRTP